MEIFNQAVIASHKTGSRYICNPAPVDTDDDTVFLVNGYYNWAEDLAAHGWEWNGKDYNLIHEFDSFRKGEENYIVTEDPEFYKGFVLATAGAKALNLLKKEDRIKLFQALREKQFEFAEDGEPDYDLNEPLNDEVWDRLQPDPVGQVLRAGDVIMLGGDRFVVNE